MKKLFLILATLIFTGTLFAQEGSSEVELKNAGNEAVRKKNYAEAYQKYEEYLKINEYKDNAVVFNTAYCASKLKNYDVAAKYFDMAIKNNYKVGPAYQGKALAEKKMNKEDEMVNTLESGIKAVTIPKDKQKLETMYATHFLKKGQEFQKAGKLEKAAENYKKIVALNNRGFKSQANVSLATLYYNHGVGILQKVTPVAHTDKPAYEAGKKQAHGFFKKAVDFLIQAQSQNPSDKEIGKLLSEIKAELAK